MSSISPNPPYFIDVIETRWKHDDTLVVDCFFRFLYCHCAPINISGYKSCIVDFYVWWTQPTLLYYRFVVPMLEVVIPSESHSPPVDDVMSSSRSDTSSLDIETISPTMMSHELILPKSWVPLRIDLVNHVLKEEGEDLGGGHVF